MCVDGGVPRRAGKVLLVPVRYMYVSLGVAVLLGQPKVDDVDEVALLAEAHQEVVGLDVSVDEVLGVNVLHPTDLKANLTA